MPFMRKLRAALAAAVVVTVAGAADESILNTRAVMTGDQVVQILDETVDWYRTLGAQQQSATQPSDLLILYANRQTADKVIDLAFEIARANAELLSSEADVGAEGRGGCRRPRRRRCSRCSSSSMRGARRCRRRSHRSAARRSDPKHREASCKRSSRSCRASSTS